MIRENGNDPRLRIALCGYDGDHDLPGWSVVKWKAHGGYSSQRSGDPNGNPHRERIWFSPGCLRGALSEPLFARLAASEVVS